MISSAEVADMVFAVAEEEDLHRALVTELQHRRGAELYAFARRLGLPPDAADDVVQESLLRLWVALDSGPPIGRPDAWLFRCLYRLCMDHHRWRRRANGLLERLFQRPMQQMPGTIADRLAIWSAVDRLPERQRLAVYLRYRADLSYEEIAAILGIRAVSARSHVSRALDRLGTLITKEDFT